jgi:hypothetical protein
VFHVLWWGDDVVDHAAACLLDVCAYTAHYVVDCTGSPSFTADGAFETVAGPGAFDVVDLMVEAVAEVNGLAAVIAGGSEAG